MTLYQSQYAKGVISAPYPAFAGAVVAHRFSHTITAALAAGDIIELAPLFNGVRVIDMILDSDDLDSGAAMLIDIGIMSGNWQANDGARTCGAEFFSASNLPQAGGVVRPTLKTAFRTAPIGADRSIGIKINAAAAGFLAGNIGLTMLYASS